jgi:lycopene cyclase domain-containing protein
MTYLQFLLLFLVPPIALLLAFQRGRLSLGSSLAWGRAHIALALMLGLALVYTTPWDNYLVAHGVWGYPPERVLLTIGYVPLEEYLFFLLQTLLSGLFLYWLARRQTPVTSSPRARTVGRWAGTILFVLLTIAGLLLARTTWGLYLGLILAWFAPVAALQWGVGGSELLRRWRLALPAVLAPTLYLWIADRLALGLGIWWVSPRYTTGLHLFGLPLEEALFFLLTNVIVVQGLLLFLTLGRRPVGQWAP